MRYIILISLISIAIAQPQSVLLKVCSSGASCYNRNRELGTCGTRNGTIFGHEFCMVNGPNRPDPQTGYIGPCDSGSADDNLCVNCVTNEICSLGNLLDTNFTLDNEYHYSVGWYPGWASCSPGNYITSTGMVFSQCIFFAICPLGNIGDDITYPCQTPKQLYTGSIYEFQNACMLLDTDVSIYSTGVGPLSGPCPNGLICAIPHLSTDLGLCVVSR
jgi:hypothetical protein